MGSQMARQYAASFAARIGRVTGDARFSAIDQLGRETEMLDFSPPEEFSILLEVNRLVCFPPLPLDERRVKTAIAALTGGTKWLDAEEAALAPPKPGNKFRMRMAGDLRLDNLPDFLVDEAVVESSVHAFYGATQAGKTFAAMDLAMCIATGRPWFGRDTLPAAVLWLAAEDPFGVEKRVKAWLIGNDAAGAPFAVLDGALFNLRQLETVDAVVERGRELLAATGMARLFIVIDTLSKATPGADEISGKDTGEVMAAFDRLKLALPATLCVIHHSGKSEGSGLRGHSSLGQGIDSFALVKKTGAGHTIEFEKVKNARLPFPIGFTLQEVSVGEYRNGKNISSCIVLPRDIRPVEVGGVPHDQTAKDALSSLATEAIKDGIDLPMALTGLEGVRGTRVKDWAIAVRERLWEGVKAPTARQYWKRTKDGLEKVGAVRIVSFNDEEYAFIVDSS